MRPTNIARKTVLLLSLAGAGALAIGVNAQGPAAADPRVGLKPGFADAGVAIRNLELMTTLPKPEGFFDPAEPAGAALPGEPAPGARPTPPSPNILAFSNSDLAFKDQYVFVGSFQVDAIKPLVERYLASLPALHRSEAAVDRGIRPPAGVVQREVVKGLDPRSQVAIVFSGPFQNDAGNRLLVKTMAQMLAGNLQRTLREDMGGTYGVSVESQFEKYPVAQYQISISFACRCATSGSNTVVAQRGNSPTRDRTFSRWARPSGSRSRS